MEILLVSSVLFFSISIIIWHFWKRRTDKKYYEQSIGDFDAIDLSYLSNRERIGLVVTALFMLGFFVSLFF
jgi:hypothetical protein